MGKTAYEKLKWNNRVMTKSGPPHVENVGSGKSQHPLNKHMLAFLETVTPSA